MMADGIYLLDSDVFMAAKNLYYSFDICPGFWKSIVHHHREGDVFSIDRIRQEIFAGDDTEELVKWVKNEIPKEFFHSTKTDRVVTAYREIMTWVQQRPQYFLQAKEEFARVADGWLVAFASVEAATVITNEESAPDSRRSIKLPDVCNRFEVRCENTFSMLRALNIQFDWVVTSG